MIFDPFLDPPRRYPGCVAAFALTVAVMSAVAGLIAAVAAWGFDDSRTVIAADVLVLAVWVFRWRPRPPRLPVELLPAPVVPRSPEVVFMRPEMFETLTANGVFKASRMSPFFGLPVFTSPLIPRGKIIVAGNPRAHVGDITGS